MSATAEVQDVVRRLNAAWVARRFEELTDLFHPDVVLATPDLARRLVGRDACVQTYRDFMSSAVVHAFDLGEVVVDAFGDMAVAICPYTIEYETGDKRLRGDGKDLLVLTRRSGAWSVAWRTLVPGREEEVQPGAGG